MILECHRAYSLDKIEIVTCAYLQIILSTHWLICGQRIVYVEHDFNLHFLGLAAVVFWRVGFANGLEEDPIILDSRQHLGHQQLLSLLPGHHHHYPEEDCIPPEIFSQCRLLSVTNCLRKFQI